MEIDKNFEAFADETLQLDELADVIGGVESEYNISLAGIETREMD